MPANTSALRPTKRATSSTQSRLWSKVRRILRDKIFSPSLCAMMLRQLLYLQLTAAPFWLEKPADLVLAPEESGRLVCRSDGAPRPTVSWFINGEPIECKLSMICQLCVDQNLYHINLCCIFSVLCFIPPVATPQPNRQVSGDTLSFRSVSTLNNAVYQCNASNEHGYLMANAFVIVLRK